MHHELDAIRYTVFSGRRAGRNYVTSFMQGLKRMYYSDMPAFNEYFEDNEVDNTMEFSNYEEMNEHMNTTLIQELFELTAERFIELEGNVEEGELELLNSLIDVLFFE